MECIACGNALDAQTVFRCYDCEQEFCKPCLVRHCRQAEALDECSRTFHAAALALEDDLDVMLRAHTARFESETAVREMLARAGRLVALAYMETKRRNENAWKTAGIPNEEIPEKWYSVR